VTLPSRAQTVVIGAGIVGVCTAMYLAREKHETVLLDRGSPWSDASGINAGTLSLQVKAPAVWSLCALALKLWSRLVGEIKGDLGFVRSGGLRVALDHGECAQLAESVRAQRAAGLAVELLERDELTEQAPWLGGEVLAASRCDEDAYASPLLAGPALLQAAESSGVLVGAHTEVTAFERCAEGYRVHTECGEIYCRNLVISAGAGTEMLAAQLGISIPVSADLNMLHVTEAAPQFMSGIITHIGGVLSLKQYTNGTCVIGGGWQGRGSLGEPSPQIDHENLHHNLRIATRVVPALRDLRLVRSWTGFEALAADGLPVLGAVPGHDGLYVGACARGGYTLGPAQAWILSQQIVGRPCELDISAFGPARFQP
jgi:sarcosine oxidase subunit beta